MEQVDLHLWKNGDILHVVIQKCQMAAAVVKNLQ